MGSRLTRIKLLSSPSGRSLHNNADALSRLVQTWPCEQVTNSSAASVDSAEDSTDKTDISAVVKTTVQVKLSHGRIATITFEGSKPLETE